jgi:SAM-dependent methyltransferase
MRDADGTIEFQAETVVRRIQPNAAAKSFLHSTSADVLVEAGKLVPYEFTTPDTLVSPRVPFVSYPFEWCDAQLHAAGRLTLDISREILDQGHELKDGSAWNVIFRGNRPIFCDLLSFQPVMPPQWWAFGQFTRHFLLPLAVSQQCKFRPHRTFSTFRDGMPPDTAREMFGLKRFITRFWPLMIAGDGKGKFGAKAQDKAQEQEQGKPMHGNLYAFCQSMLDGVEPNQVGKSHWAHYAETRDHYTDEAFGAKYGKVGEWIERIKPEWVVDLGCNTGEFTRLSAKAGAQVIAVDLDHDSVQNLVLTQSESTAIHPLVTNLGDMVGGRGWCGDEFPSLMTRLHQRADVLLMLALTHHLAISEGLAMDKIAQMAAHITRDYLIVEMLDETDPMVTLLCSQRRREPREFSLAAQEKAYARFFESVARYPIPATRRVLCLLKKIAQ